MHTRILTNILTAALLIVLPAAAFSGSDPAESVQEHMAALVAMCDASSEARTARHAETSLYERMGGYDRILALTTEVVRLHHLNEPIKQMVEHVDGKLLAKNVADFIAAGTGGPQKYAGRDLVSSHADLELTDAHFLAAGSDIMTAMKTLGFGQEETDELLCIFVSLKDQVVLTK